MTTHADITRFLDPIGDVVSIWCVDEDTALDMIVKAGYEALLKNEGITPREYGTEPIEEEEE